MNAKITKINIETNDPEFVFVVGKEIKKPIIFYMVGLSIILIEAIYILIKVIN